MLADIRPLLNEQVEHWLPPTRSVHGDVTKAGSTTHAARILYAPGQTAGPASRENMPDAKATIWLLNHPRPIAIGDTFELPDGEALNVIGVEGRTAAADTLHKIYLS